MKVKSLALLLFVAGCGSDIKVEWLEPDSSCYEVHDSETAVDIAADASQAVEIAQSVSPSTDASSTAD